MKLQISTLSVILLFTVFSMMISCTKEGNDETNHKSHQSYNVAKRINIPYKAGETPGGGGSTVNPGGPIFDITLRTGHKRSACNGQCKIYGLISHVECQGIGNACSVSAVIRANENNNVVFNMNSTQNIFEAIGIYENDLTADNNFIFPASSFLIEGVNDNIWLNIPAQILHRSSDNNMFIYYGLFYSKYPVFE